MLRLALQLGLTADELLSRLTSEELQEWMIFDSIEPIGAWRGDFQFGMLCALFANANRRKGAPPFKPMDFMPFMPDNESDGVDQEAALKMFQVLAQKKNTKKARG